MAKLTILLAFVALILCDACFLPKPCNGEPQDFPVSVIAYTNNPILGTPIKDVPFVFTFTNCVSNSRTTIKSDTLFTNEKGRIDSLFKATKFLCSELVCQPKLDIQPLPSSKFIKWSYGNNNSYEFKERAVLKLQIIHDSTDVNSLRLVASQKNSFSNFSRQEVQVVATNKTSFNVTALFTIAKEADTQLTINFDNKAVRSETIKGSQLDTIFRLITL